MERVGFFFSFLVLCERPGSAEQLPVERRRAGDRHLSAEASARPLSGIPQAEVLSFFLYKNKPKKLSEGGVDLKMSRPLFFFLLCTATWQHCSCLQVCLEIHIFVYTYTYIEFYIKIYVEICFKIFIYV